MLLNLPVKSLSLRNFRLLFCLSLASQIPHWHSSLPFVLALWHLQKMRSDIISLQLTASFALHSQNIHNNPDNVWLCPLTPIRQCTCVRRKMDMCWEDECRSQPLLSDPDCKSVRALTADCFSSGLQRRKKVAGNLEMNHSESSQTLTSPLPCLCSVRIASPSSGLRSKMKVKLVKSGFVWPLYPRLHPSLSHITQLFGKLIFFCRENRVQSHPAAQELPLETSHWPQE